MNKLIVFVALMFLMACSNVQPPPRLPAPQPLAMPISNHTPARGCEGQHDTFYLPGVNIDAYPSLPPKAEPKHVILHLDDRTTIWMKPDYGMEDCRDYLNCRRATLVVNPAWNSCAPQGTFYQVATLDGRLLLDSNFWQVSAEKNMDSVYVGFACGRGFAGPDFTILSNQIAQKACSSETLPALPAGKTLAAAMALSTTYFSYRAAYDRSVECFSYELNAATTSANCY